MTKLRDRLDGILKEYIAKFEKKHDVEMEFAVQDDLMGIISFGDINCFDIGDIVEDIDNNYPKGLILDWMMDNVDHNSLVEYENWKNINLKSYAMGLRFTDLNK